MRPGLIGVSCNGSNFETYHHPHLTRLPTSISARPVPGGDADNFRVICSGGSIGYIRTFRLATSWSPWGAARLFIDCLFVYDFFDSNWTRSVWSPACAAQPPSIWPELLSTSS
jgi:hypothetical protein